MPNFQTISVKFMFYALNSILIDTRLHKLKLQRSIAGEQFEQFDEGKLCCTIHIITSTSLTVPVACLVTRFCSAWA